MPSLVSIVILQFNNSEDTIKCLAFVKELSYPNFEVIVVDNASEPPHLENTENYLKSQLAHNSYFIIHNSKNSGYAGGNNIGIKKALENSADYVLILNNDTEVPPDLLEKLIGVFKSNKDIGIVGPLLKENNHITAGGKILWLKPHGKHILYKNQKSLITVDYVPGTCMLISRQTIEKIGLLPEEYFLYFEDADYCLKAHKIGIKCVITPEIAVNHKEHGSTAKIGSPLVLRYHFRNSLYFNRKNGPFWAKIAIYPWSLWIIGKQLVKLILGINREQSKAIFRGVMDFYRNRLSRIT